MYILTNTDCTGNQSNLFPLFSTGENMLTSLPPNTSAETTESTGMKRISIFYEKVGHNSCSYIGCSIMISPLSVKACFCEGIF